MKANWTKWARAQLLPVPGEPWKVSVDLKKSQTKVPGVPAKPALDAEIARGGELRLNERYDEKGGHPRDTIARDLVDIWVARAGVAFTTQVLLGACTQPRRETVSRKGPPPPYDLRRDGQPWARLREHLAAASETDRAAAKKLAEAARGRDDELRQAVAYAFCDPAWVAEDLEQMFRDGYGQLALLAALPDASSARMVLQRLLADQIRKFQLVEEAPPHMPNLVARLDEADADLVRQARDRAYKATLRKPWDALVDSLPAPS